MLEHLRRLNVEYNTYIRVGRPPSPTYGVNDCCGRFGRRRASPWHSSRAQRFGQTFELTRATFEHQSTVHPCWYQTPTQNGRFALRTVAMRDNLLDVYGRLVHCIRSDEEIEINSRLYGSVSYFCWLHEDMSCQIVSIRLQKSKLIISLQRTTSAMTSHWLKDYMLTFQMQSNKI